MAEINPTWQQFELAVKNLLSKEGADLQSYQVLHDEKVPGVDGNYQVDVSVRFEVLGADFLVLVECKHWKGRVKRERVEILENRLHSIGAQKGMIFATGGFQSGAIEYAKVHGIALVHVTHSGMEYFAKGMDMPSNFPHGPVPRFSVVTATATPFDAGEASPDLRAFFSI